MVTTFGTTDTPSPSPNVHEAILVCTTTAVDAMHEFRPSISRVRWFPAYVLLATCVFFDRLSPEYAGGGAPRIWGSSATVLVALSPNPVLRISSIFFLVDFYLYLIIYLI
jgi:hypothetical protein